MPTHCSARHDTATDNDMPSRPKPQADPHCGSSQCMFARELPVLIEKLHSIETQVAVIVNNFIKLDEFVTLREEVKMLQQQTSELRRMFYAGCGLVLSLFLAAVVAMVLK